MKIIIGATNGESLLNFRGKMIQSWIELGHEVFCISIETEQLMIPAISNLGAKYVQVVGTRTGISIRSGLRMIKAYKKVFDALKPDLVFFYMSKPIIFGGIAAILGDIKRIVIFQTGLEIAFYSKGIRNKFIKYILKILYRFVQKYAEIVFFMSHSDQEKMIKWKLVKPEKCQYVDGSGVDLSQFQQRPMPKTDAILLVARLVWSKGIREYIEAAKIVKKKYSDVPFMLVGGLDTNDESLSEKELNELIDHQIIEYFGYQKDVRPYLEKCSIFVLPSYHEGKGKVILEAMAVGRPVITTDAPGCSETIIEGYNGFTVPARDAESLAMKIIELLENRALMNEMSENARKHCESNFDVLKINNVINQRMGFI